MDPFNMTPSRGNFNKIFNKHLGKLQDIDIYIPPSAAHLYDSVVLFAKVIIMSYQVDDLIIIHPKYNSNT